MGFLLGSITEKNEEFLHKSLAKIVVPTEIDVFIF